MSSESANPDKENVDPEVDHIEELSRWYIARYETALKYAVSYAPSPDLAHDVVQAAYIEFINETKSIAVGEDRDTILKRVCSRVAKRHWQDRLRQSSDNIAKIGRHLALISQSYFEDKDFEEQLYKLNNCLDSLSAKSRKLIEQHYRYGLPISLLSQQFKVTPRAIYKAISSIRDRLKNCINRISK